MFESNNINEGDKFSINDKSNFPKYVSEANILNWLSNEGIKRLYTANIPSYADFPNLGLKIPISGVAAYILFVASNNTNMSIFFIYISNAKTVYINPILSTKANYLKILSDTSNIYIQKKYGGYYSRIIPLISAEINYNDASSISNGASIIFDESNS